MSRRAEAFAGSVPEGACEDEYSTGGCTGFRRLEGGRPGSLECRIPVIMVPDLMPPTEVQKRQAIKIIASLSEAVPIIEELSKDGTKHERCI